MSSEQEQIDIDNLKNKAAFKFPEIEQGMHKLKAQKVISNNKLSRIVTLLEQQQKSDKARHEINKRYSVIAIIIASCALYIAAVETGIYTDTINIIKGLL